MPRQSDRNVILHLSSGISKWGRRRVAENDENETEMEAEYDAGEDTRGNALAAEHQDHENMEEENGPSIFEAYFRAQGLLNTLEGYEADWESFLSSLKQPLPVTFRYV